GDQARRDEHNAVMQRIRPIHRGSMEKCDPSANHRAYARHVRRVVAGWQWIVGSRAGKRDRPNRYRSPTPAKLWQPAPSVRLASIDLPHPGAASRKDFHDATSARRRVFKKHKVGPRAWINSVRR